MINLIFVAGLSCSEAGACLKTPLTAISQSELNRISDNCNSPRSQLRRKKNGEIHFKPNVKSRYLSVDCVLGALKARHAENMGFIGNEMPAPDHP